MITRVVTLILGGALSAFLALTWIRVHRERGEFVGQRRLLESGQAELERHTAELEADLEETTKEITRARLLVAASLTPAERAREAVGALVARLKQNHLLNPPPARPPPLPSGPMGSFFPELMGDLEYNRLYAVTVRSRVEQQHRALLKKLGVPEETADRVITLLTEREMIAADNRSIAGMHAGIPGPIYDQQRKLREETDATIRRLLGDTAYNGFTEDIPDTTITRNADGTSTPQQVARKGIPDYRRANGFEFQSLELRLSYSPAPLTETQKNSLSDWLRTADGKNRDVGYLLRSEPFLEQVRTTLRPDQQFALDEINAESEADQKRRKLPNAQPSPLKAKPPG